MKKTVAIPIITIQLSDLSRLWVHEDMPKDMPIERPVQIKEHVSQEKWKKPKISDFYANYVLPYKRSIADPQLQIIGMVLALFDNGSGSCPSVVAGDPDTDSRYCELTIVTLFDHTLSVAKNAHDLHKKSNNDSHVSMGLVLIAALSHDLGKCPPVSRKFGKGLPNHVIASTEWLKSVGEDVKNLPMVTEAVCYHHATDKEIKRRCSDQNYILSILRQADLTAREKELKEKAQHRQSNRRHLPENAAIMKESVSTKETIVTIPESVSVDEMLGLEEPQKEGKIIIDDTHESQESAFSEWFDEERLFEAIGLHVTSNGLDAFFHEENIYVSAKALYRIINDMRKERNMLLFGRIEDARTYLSVKIFRMKNAQCQISFRKELYRQPLKAYYYIVDTKYMKNVENLDTGLANDMQGHFVHSIRIVKTIEHHGQLPRPEGRRL